jgi:hypothetical protein
MRIEGESGDICGFLIKIDHDIWDIDVRHNGQWRRSRTKLIDGEEYTIISRWLPPPDDPPEVSSLRGWGGRDFFNLYCQSLFYLTGRDRTVEKDIRIDMFKGPSKDPLCWDKEDR